MKNLDKFGNSEQQKPLTAGEQAMQVLKETEQKVAQEKGQKDNREKEKREMEELDVLLSQIIAKNLENINFDTILKNAKKEADDFNKTSKHETRIPEEYGVPAFLEEIQTQSQEIKTKLPNISEEKVLDAYKEQITNKDFFEKNIFQFYEAKTAYQEHRDKSQTDEIKKERIEKKKKGSYLDYEGRVEGKIRTFKIKAQDEEDANAEKEAAHKVLQENREKVELMKAELAKKETGIIKPLKEKEEAHNKEREENQKIIGPISNKVNSLRISRYGAHQLKVKIDENGNFIADLRETFNKMIEEIKEIQKTVEPELNNLQKELDTVKRKRVGVFGISQKEKTKQLTALKEKISGKNAAMKNDELNEAQHNKTKVENILKWINDKKANFWNDKKEKEIFDGFLNGSVGAILRVMKEPIKNEGLTKEEQKQIAEFKKEQEDYLKAIQAYNKQVDKFEEEYGEDAEKIKE